MNRITALSKFMTRIRRRSTSRRHLFLFSLHRLRTHPRERNEAMIRGLCANAYLGEGRSLCRVLGRYKMVVDPGDVGLSSHLLLDGYWEMWLTELLAGLVQPGMTVVDIGANLGYFTILMADRAGPGGQVHAFEPNADLAHRLRQSVSINGFGGHTRVHEQALADQEGDVLLVVPTGEPKNGHLLPGDHPIGADAAVETHSLRTRRLDSYPDLLDADLIKIDADTSELSIWQGMSGLLERKRPLTVILEFARVRYPDPGAFIDLILAEGFSLAEITLNAGVRPTTREDILAAPPTDDVMLMLVR